MARRSIIAGIALLASAVLPAAALAQARPIEVSGTKTWRHAESDLALPPSLAGLKRTEITATGAGELDIAAQYGDGNKTQATLYLFRPALASVPVWFDRIETQILQRGSYGVPVALDGAPGFAAPKASTTSAMRRIYKPSAPPYAATGFAVMPMGAWLVVVRISSLEQAPAALDATLSALIADLDWPSRARNAPEAPAAVPVQPCATPLAYDPGAQMQKPDMQAGLLGSLFAMAASTKDKTARPTPPPVFCREGAASALLAVYRNTAADAGGYVIAVGDAGRTVSVTPELQLDEKKKPGFAVTLNLLDRAYIFPSFDRLPAPEQVMQALGKTRPISSVDPGGRRINITTP